MRSRWGREGYALCEELVHCKRLTSLKTMSTTLICIIGRKICDICLINHINFIPKTVSWGKYKFRQKFDRGFKNFFSVLCTQTRLFSVCLENLFSSSAFKINKIFGSGMILSKWWKRLEASVVCLPHLCRTIYLIRITWRWTELSEAVQNEAASPCYDKSEESPN